MTEERLSRGGIRLTPIALLTLVIPAIYLLTYLLSLPFNGNRDWDAFLCLHRLAVWNWTLYGPEKGWNPLMRGGMSLAGDPNVGVFSLSVILSRLFNPAAALKLTALVYVAAGGWGAARLARRFRFEPSTARLAGALFMANGYMVARLKQGHVDFLPAFLLPLWLLASRACLTHPGEGPGTAGRRLALFILGGGAVFALMGDGAPMAVLFTALWTGLDALFLSVSRRTARPLLFVAGAMASGFLLDAVYFFPVVTNQAHFPRIQPAHALDPLVFVWGLLVPLTGAVLPAPARMHEFMVYVGPVLAWLIWKYRRRIADGLPRDEAWRFAGVSMIVFLIGLGSWRTDFRWAPPAPYDLIAWLPGFRSTSLPARFWGYMTLPLALAGALALAAFDAGARPGWRRTAGWIAVFLFTAGFQVVSLSYPFLLPRGHQVVPMVTPPGSITTITNVRRPAGWSQAAAIWPDRGVIEAYNNQEYLHGDIEPGGRLVRLATSGADTLRSVAGRWQGWNRIVVDLPALPAPARVVLNQNGHPVWRASRGTLGVTGNGNMLLDVPAGGAGEVTLEFRDPWVDRGWRVTRTAAAVWLVLAAGLSAAAAISSRRP